MEAWLDDLQPVQRLVLYSVVSIATALGLAGVSAVVETAVYKCYCFLERRGAIERLVPGIDITNDAYKLATAKTFVGSTFLTLLFMCYVHKDLIAMAKPDWNPIRIYASYWALCIVHDWWFWAVHMVMHKVKYLYSKIHSQHPGHPDADLTIFGTADMHFVEAFFLFMGFYLVLFGIYFLRGEWNPVSYGFIVLAEASMNMGGHCGYHMPAWLQFLVTLGVGNTPWSASSKTHFIHHLDPRTNRALYFTWCDKFSGTYRPTHPRIKEFTPEEQRAYNSKAFKLLWKELRGWAQ
jgi:sterol desaturase/sphingolipid hydroxylase (fatty acid hydroxylase superfamily)